MKNDTREQPRVEPGVRRLPELRCAEQGGGWESADDSWVLCRSHRSGFWQANVQGSEGTNPSPEARRASATPPLQARVVLPQVCGAANPSVSPSRQLRAGSLALLYWSQEVSPPLKGAWAGWLAGPEDSRYTDRGPGEEGPPSRLRLGGLIKERFAKQV